MQGYRIWMLILLWVLPFWQFVFYGVGAFLLVKRSLGLADVEPRLSLVGYTSIFLEAQYRTALIDTLLVVGGSAIVCIVFGALAGAFVNQFRTRLARLSALAVVVVPFFMDPAIRALGWHAWMTQEGYLGGGLLGGGGGLLYSAPAVYLGLIGYGLPISILIHATGFARSLGDLPSAARNLGASDLQVLWHVIVPAMAPYTLAAGLMCSLLFMGDYVYASTLGSGAVYTISMAIADRFRVDDWAGASALGVMLAVASLVLLALIFTTVRYVMRNEPSR